MPRLTTEVREQRRQARPINRELRAAGLPVPKTHRCFEVTISAIPVPAWAVAKALTGFASTANSVVLKARKDAWVLAGLDRAKGGKPMVDRFEYRRCNACDRLMVRDEAARAREWERRHPRERFLCGSSCKHN